MAKMTIDPTNKDEKETALWDRVAGEVAIVCSTGMIQVALSEDDETINNAMSMATAVAANMADRMVALRRHRTNLIETPSLIIP